MKGRIIRSFVVVALFVAAVMPGARAQVRTHSFDGNCSVEGTVTFDPPATAMQQILDVSYVAGGTCTGTLDGKQISNAPATVRNHARSNGSCVYAQTIDPGNGALTFGNRTVLSYTFDFTYVGTEGAITYNGSRSGSALGHGTFLTPNSSPDAASGCYDGNGVPKLTMDIMLVTQSPLVSGDVPRPKN
jgi:hypothetical protein